MMNSFKQTWQNWNIVIVLAASKLAIHFLTNTNYNFHRDEYLHLILGEHLSWGYMEVPPVIAVFGKIALSLGGSVFVTRLFPALIGAITVILIGVMVRDLGGKKWAQALACLAFILSPAFLRSNTLFQPVSFNQFCWFLSALFIVRLTKSENPRYWLFIGIMAGIGFLTKYSIVFFFTAFLLALLLAPQRKWLRTKYPYLAFGVAFVIAFPNLLWQVQHNLPIVRHITELSQTQLVHINISGFLLSQLRTHHAALLVWLVGLFYLFFSPKLSAFRLLGWTYLFVIAILLVLSGKSYYALGAYPMLMAAGGVALENLLAQRSAALKYALIAAMVILTLPILPYGLPILKVENMQRYCAFMKDNFGMTGQLTWEDGKIYPLPQDYADMHGWQELAERVSRLYHSLPPEEQKKCMIFGGSYSHASSLNYYRKKYDLPEIYSFNGSFLMWAPDSVDFDRQIMADDVVQTQSGFFANMYLADQIQNPYAREPGYIYYRSEPKIDVRQKWRELVAERKKVFDF